MCCQNMGYRKKHKITQHCAQSKFKEKNIMCGYNLFRVLYEIITIGNLEKEIFKEILMYFSQNPFLNGH